MPMTVPINPFDVVVTELDNKEEIHFLNIEKLTPELESLIDNNITAISNPDLETRKRTRAVLANFFKNKHINTTMGAVAEFIIHLYLNHIGFNQECLFLNLEEGSIKKGFDGYYSFASEEWIMESKSGLISTSSISHDNKIDEAYKDLESKIEGPTANNPWQNALHHARIAGATNNILTNIKGLSNMYIDGTFPVMKDLNIVPTSTIYHKNNWGANNKNRNTTNLELKIDTFNYSQLKVICVNKKSLNVILNYLIN